MIAPYGTAPQTRIMALDETDRLFTVQGDTP